MRMLGKQGRGGLLIPSSKRYRGRRCFCRECVYDTSNKALRLREKLEYMREVRRGVA